MHPENPFYDALRNAIATDLRRSPPKFGFPARVIAVADIELDDIVIGVFGATGSGKSTFIQALVEKEIFPLLPKGSPYDVSGIKCVQISIPSAKNHLILVELPGFGDAGVSDARTLSIIYRWFELLYDEGKRLDGAIFVDPITPAATTSPSHQDLKILQKIYGESHHECVTLVSTHWDKILPNHRAKAQRRERELIATSWRRFLNEEGPGLTARFDRRDNLTAFLHASEVVSTLVGQMRSATHGIKLLIQKQVIDHGLPLYWTDAGKMVFTMEEIERYREVMMPLVPTSPLPDAEERIVASVDINWEDITDDDIIVGVFGETGAGKSSFIQSLSNGAESSIRIGHHDPGTSEVTCVRVWIPQLESHVVVVDTPGFNNPTRTDVEVLETIAEWLVQLYRLGKRLNAALYLHRITDIRIDSGTQQSLNIFLNMYGRTNYDHLGLVTTMWNNVPWFEYDNAEKREQDLSSNTWSSFLTTGDSASIQRFNLTAENAYHDSMRIICELMGRVADNHRISLRIQEQMVDGQLLLRETDAGTLAARDPDRESVPDTESLDPNIGSGDESTETSTVEGPHEHAQLPAEEVTVHTITHEDIIIGVYGATGVGKTTFIDALAEGRATWLTVGESMDPGTTTISCVRISVPGWKRRVVLVDSPGFDDQTKTDGQILTMITTWLRSLHGVGLLLSGAIYINQITSVRIDAGTQKAMNIFRKMFGDKENDRIMLVTSKWNDIHADHMEMAESREKDLFEDAWAIFLNSQPPATTARFHYNSDDDSLGTLSASRILTVLLHRLENRGGIKLFIQQQMIDEYKPIQMTDAGLLAFEVPQEHDTSAEAIEMDEIDEDDIIICLLGETGSGKTTFIATLAGEDAPGLDIGHELEAGTKSITCVRFTISHLDESVVLVDTPGFNRNDQSDSQTLEIIANWLKDSYAAGHKLHGILFLQNVGASTRTSAVERTSRIFHKMFGDTPVDAARYDQITFVTTMWSDIPKDDYASRMDAKDQEDLLRSTTWSAFLTGPRRASLHRFDCSTRQSAHDHALDAIRTLIKGTRRPEPLKLRIQEEMVEKKLSVAKTSAGKFAKPNAKELKRLKSQRR